MNADKGMLDFALDCGSITAEIHRQLVNLNEEIGRMLGAMIKNPAPFLLSDR